MNKKMFTSLLVLSGLTFVATAFADEIRMKDIDTLSKKNKVIIINKDELSKYLHLGKKKKLQHQKPTVKKLSEEKLLKKKIKNKNLINSLLLYKKFIAKNQRSAIIDNLILIKAKKINSLDFMFFKKDFLESNAKKMSNIIKELKNEYK